MIRKIALTIFLFLLFVLPKVVYAQSPTPEITSVSTHDAHEGDAVIVYGNNFLIPNTDIPSLKIYLIMPTGGVYTLASVSPSVNNTSWESNAVSFRITDSIPRTGVIRMTVNNKIAYHDEVFNMNGGIPPTSTPSPYPTNTPTTQQDPVATNTSTPQPQQNNTNETVNSNINKDEEKNTDITNVPTIELSKPVGTSESDLISAKQATSSKKINISIIAVLIFSVMTFLIMRETKLLKKIKKTLKIFNHFN